MMWKAGGGQLIDLGFIWLNRLPLQNTLKEINFAQLPAFEGNIYTIESGVVRARLAQWSGHAQGNQKLQHINTKLFENIARSIATGYRTAFYPGLHEYFL
jgi:hypothetical protein